MVGIVCHVIKSGHRFSNKRHIINTVLCFSEPIIKVAIIGNNICKKDTIIIIIKQDNNHSQILTA